jgi:phospholipid transport system substrate-binding protein
MDTEYSAALKVNTQTGRMARYALVLLVLPVLALAGNTRPIDVIRGASEEVLQQLNAESGIRSDPVKLNRLIQAHIAPHVDFTALSRLTLGKQWRRTTPEQRSLFVREFAELLIRIYATALATYSNHEIAYLSSTVAGNGRRATVRTRIVEAGRAPLTVDYSLRRIKESWKIFDVKIEGVSLVISYRSSFAQEIRERGLDGLIEGLAARNAAGAAGKVAAAKTTSASYDAR